MVRDDESRMLNILPYLKNNNKIKTTQSPCPATKGPGRSWTRHTITLALLLRLQLALIDAATCGATTVLDFLLWHRRFFASWRVPLLLAWPGLACWWHGFCSAASVSLGLCLRKPALLSTPIAWPVQFVSSLSPYSAADMTVFGVLGHVGDCRSFLLRSRLACSCGNLQYFGHTSSFLLHVIVHRRFKPRRVSVFRCMYSMRHPSPVMELPPPWRVREFIWFLRFIWCWPVLWMRLTAFVLSWSWCKSRCCWLNLFPTRSLQLQPRHNRLGQPSMLPDVRDWTTSIAN